MARSAFNIALNALIFAPAIFIYIYIFPYFYPYLDIIILVVLSSLPFVKYLVPFRFRHTVYPVSAIAVLLLILATLTYNFNPSTYYYLRIFALPLELSTAFAFVFALVLIFIAEGILSRGPARAMGLLLLSLGSMLDELTIIAAMHEFALSFMSAIGLVLGLDVESYYELFVYGYQEFLPMANFQITIGYELLILFIVSTIAIVFSIYLREKDHQRERLADLGFSMVGGAIVGALLFAIYDFFSYTQYQLSIIGFAVVVTFIVMARTSRKGDARLPEIKNNTGRQ
ncbi:MAG: hypothetical protein QW597_00935 [Thermoplasmataceae archaeon]